MEKIALKIKDLKKTYKTGTEALKGVSLNIERGEFFGLLGPNGAGKTTIIGIITGLVNKTGGKVSVFDANIDEEPEKSRTYIGVVPQEMNFNIFETVINIVVDQAGFYGIPRKVAIERAEKLLKDLGLYEKRNDKSMALSGGMKRRLMIARALIHNPKFLVLDEPTAGVDVELRRGMWEYLETLTKEGVTILLTTHYLEEAERLCKRVAIINKGQIIEEGTTKDLLKRMKSELLILDLESHDAFNAEKELHEFSPKIVDEDTVEVEIKEGRSVTEVINMLSKVGIKVKTVRQKSSRLEELFVKLTS